MVKPTLLALSIAAACPSIVYAATDAQQDLATQLQQLKLQVEALESRLAEQAKQQTAAENQQNAAPVAVEKNVDEKPADGIEVGGAVRTNFSHTSYDEGNKNRGGDFDFDLLRLDFRGTVGDVSLNAEIRFFDYMTAVKKAYVAYQLDELWQAQLGITQVPFGNWPYNSNNYFFSSNYYLGLEDDHDLGLLFKRLSSDQWQLDIGFFKNDELGGIDGYVGDKTDRYSYDIVGARGATEDIYGEPVQALAETNTFASRFGYHVAQGQLNTELGFSVLSGKLHHGARNAGDYQAFALHLNSRYQRWQLQLQHSQYHYDLDDIERVAVGAYGFYDSIAAEAKSATVNLAYDLPVQWGPITDLQFYNNYSLVYDKSDQSRSTLMNVTGFSIAAGSLFTYVDYAHARNQPFVGGSMAGNSSDEEQRFNINIGYYF
ncbi:carbohydrate porin [Rheinheimera sediminis]|uniref:porin n=1 Tax=Rheinheimera sp. YQF-1 TaxID=2499626 RepID=UPI000FD7B56E|nr:porin [Rheinheimera sp. YQF-1]RVT49065.1 carbohydrate porin [Rheinheimera sp. YQF-1]